MSAALHAEWTKLRTLPGTGWLLLGVVAATVIISATVSASMGCSSAAACHADVTKLSLTGTYLGQAVVAIVAVLAVGGEYATGMIRTTLAATPRRTTLLAAKAGVVTAVTLVAGTLAVLGSLLAGRLILPGHGYTPANGYPVLSLANGTVLRAGAGTVLYLALIALLSLGIAAVVRDAAVAIGAVLGLLYLFPVLAQVGSEPSTAAAPAASVTALTTAALAASTVVRRGMAARVVRIMPVPYSPVTASTATMATTAWPR